MIDYYSHSFDDMSYTPRKMATLIAKTHKKTFVEAVAKYLSCPRLWVRERLGLVNKERQELLSLYPSNTMLKIDSYTRQVLDVIKLDTTNPASFPLDF